MVSQYYGYAAHGGSTNVPAITPSFSPRNKRGKNHGDWNGFPIQRRSRRLCPTTEMKGAFTNMAQDHQPLKGRGLIIRNPMARGGIANRDHLLVHQGLLNRTPGVTTAHDHGGVRDERHCRRRIPWNWRRQIKKKGNRKSWARRLGSFRKRRQKSDGGHKSKCSLHLKWRRNSSVTSESWNQALKFHTTI